MKYLCSDLKRSFFSPYFLISIIGIVATYIVGDWGDLVYSTDFDIVSFYNVSKSIGGFSQLIIIFSALPVAMSFCEDIESKYIRFYIIREGIFRYSISKVISTLVISILTIILGVGITVILLSFKLPILATNSVNYDTFLSERLGFFLRNGNYCMYFLGQTYYMALISSLLVLIGVIITTYLPNKLLSITAPFICYFVLMQIGNALKLNNYLRINTLMTGYFSLGSELIDFLYVFFIFIFFATLLTYLFYKRVRANVEEG